MSIRCRRLGFPFLITTVLLFYTWESKDISPLETGPNLWPSRPARYTVSTDNFNGTQGYIGLWQDNSLCATQRRTTNFDDDLFSLPIIHRHNTPNVTADNIFLVETSCSPRPTYRAWCSVESWAGQNPEKEVWFVLTSPFISDPTRVMTRLLVRYPNIRVVGINLTAAFMDTPLLELFISNKWIGTSAWPPVNLSDMLRAVVLWKWGGFYTDTDVICIKSTKGLSNVVTRTNIGAVSNAVLHGLPRHQVYWKLMEDIQKNFNGDVWGQNGPAAITRVMRKECNVTTFEKIAANSIACNNMTVLTMKYFYPFPWEANAKFFEEMKENNFEKLFNGTYGLHFWNKLTKTRAITVGSNSILEAAAKRFCPITYQVATSHSNFF